MPIPLYIPSTFIATFRTRSFTEMAERKLNNVPEALSGVLQAKEIKSSILNETNYQCVVAFFFCQA